MDAVGQNHGQLIGGAGFGPGRLGQAFSFDGVSALVVSRTPALRGVGNFTYALFINVTAYTNGAMGDGTGSNFLDRTSETQNLVTLKAVSDRFAFQVRYDDGSGLGGPIGGVIIAKTWMHVAMVREAGTRFALYVDGVFVGSTPDNGGVLTPPAFKLGRHDFLAGFTGHIDEMRIYDAALDAAQIDALASGQKCE